MKKDHHEENTYLLLFNEL